MKSILETAVVMLILVLVCWPGVGMADDYKPDGNASTIVNFKPGKGLDIVSPDKKFKLNLKLFSHILYSAIGDDGPDYKGKYRGSNDWGNSLMIRRLWLYMSGNIFGEHNKYKIQLGFSPKDMGLKDSTITKSPLMDWYLTFDYLRDLTLQIGQYRIPFNKQNVMGYSGTQFVDRAAGNFEFKLDRDIGFEVMSKDFLGLDMIRYHLGVFMGEGRDGIAESDFGLLYLARFEFLPLGMYKDYEEVDLARMKKPGLSIGFAYAYLDRAKLDKGTTGSVPDDGGTTDFHVLTADLGFKYYGVSVSGEFYYRYGSRNWGSIQKIDDNGNPVFEVDGVTPVIDKEDARNGLGWYAQVGWLIPWAPVEFVGRYGQVHPVGDDTSLFRLDELGVGCNWYIYGKGLAIKTDYHRRWGDQGFDMESNEIRLSIQAAL